MAGKYVAAAKLFQNDYPQATYVHCQAHWLYPCVCDTCKIPAIRNMTGIIQTVHDFIYFPKQHHLHVSKR